MPPITRDMLRRLEALERRLDKIQQDQIQHPVRYASPGSDTGLIAWGVVRDVGNGTERKITIERVIQIDAAPYRKFTGQIIEVHCWGNLIANEYGPFVCTYSGDWITGAHVPEILLLRGERGWIAVPWTPMEVVAEEDLDQYPRTDGY
ncbi:hypothetical protein AMJ85_11910 [candidate division BRC1 bacterium SM23_51]|nr:MAG: hypothetical protein AMJ85_11910 [candidate division BRC1 bacterium SM23_51]